MNTQPSRQMQRSWHKVTEYDYRSNTRVKAMRECRMIWCSAGRLVSM